MNHDETSIAEEIIRQVKDDLLPQDSCVNCNNRQAVKRTLYAICARANRQWESRGGGFVWGTLWGIPFLIPTPSGETVELREGRDLVVPLPLRVCDDCWRDLDGGLPARILAFFSQGLFLAGLVMIVVWVVSKMRRAEVSFLYAVACLGAAVPFYIAGELVHSRRPKRMRGYLEKIPQYAVLFKAYPNAEVVTKEPIALVSHDI